jgi:hypothetical protein
MKYKLTVTEEHLREWNKRKKNLRFSSGSIDANLLELSYPEAIALQQDLHLPLRVFWSFIGILNKDKTRDEISFTTNTRFYNWHSWHSFYGYNSSNYPITFTLEIPKEWIKYYEGD